MANPFVSDFPLHDNAAAVHYDQCHPCHETGCPNSRKTWVADRGEFVLFVDCFECGYPFEVGTVCDCQQEAE